jgi:hypothetical protein
MKVWREEEVYLVDVAEDDVVDGIVFEHFTDDTAVATAYDQDVLWVWMARKRKMGNDLLISGWGVLAELGT